LSPNRGHARRRLAATRKTWLVVGALVIGGTGVAAATVATTGDGTPKSDEIRPVKAHVKELGGTDAKQRSLPRTNTEAFSLIGVTWEDSATRLHATAQVRTRSTTTGTWTDWQDLDFDVQAPETAEGGEPAVRGASEPLWVGPSDAVEARVAVDGETTTALPAGLRLDMIDPGVTAKGNSKDKGVPKGSKTPSPTLSETTGSSGGSPEPAPSQDPDTTPTAGDPGGEDTTGSPTGSTTGDGTDSGATTGETAEPSAEPAPGSPAPSPSPEESTSGSGAPDPSPEPSTDPTDAAPGGSSEPVPSQDPATSPTAGDPGGEDTTGSPTGSPTGDGTGESDPAPISSSDPTPAVPPYISRVGWGADEALVEDAPTYLNKVEAVFVHHTAGTNDYSCADSPAIVRSLFAYHVQQLGWNDIGYNFVVDKCGTVYEGRAGGVDRPVLGAHTYGFNSYSSGITVLGNYEDGGTPTQAAKSAVAQVAGWKLGLHGVDPQGKVTLTAAGDTGVYTKGETATLYTISGHRDGYNTLCPGVNLYSALPEIRASAT
jgi:uncharacterized protein with LGFP repeats